MKIIWTILRSKNCQDKKMRDPFRIIYLKWSSNEDSVGYIS